MARIPQDRPKQAAFEQLRSERPSGSSVARTRIFGLCGAAVLGAGFAGVGHATAHSWDDRALPAERRASLALAELTQAEKLSLVHGVLGAPWNRDPKPQGAIGSAGYVPGIPRLGIPSLQETDAELGVANPGGLRPGDTATAMPSNLALASTWDIDLAHRQGEAVGAEARARGFTMVLGGTANLIREPRGGRNFEYLSEDPLVTGVMAGAAIAGVQSRHILDTAKHFVLNAQETDRVFLDARVDPGGARESDLLAFELALERGRPASIMCAYNLVNGIYSCENAWLLSDVLKRDWAYAGFVLSDWGAVHSTGRAVIAGLDQESAEQVDTKRFLGEPLAESIAQGEVPQARLDDMVRRILTSMFGTGLYDDPPIPAPLDTDASDATALAIAREGAVLLKNDAVLPLAADTARIAVIGAHSDRGVLSGGGSSQVIPRGGAAVSEPDPGGVPGTAIFDPSSPLDAVHRRWPRAEVDFDDGSVLAQASAVAAKAEVALVFVDKWSTEAADATDLRLPGRQDDLVDAVARANPRTVVVLETGGPVLMPWLGTVAGVIEIWYPGQKGADALADVLDGSVNPSGHLPITFPRSDLQLPHPMLPRDPGATSIGRAGGAGQDRPAWPATYEEGSSVGYRWFERTGGEPLFPFGFGLSYTSFALGKLSATSIDGTVRVAVEARNSGARAGATIVQIYVSGPEKVSGPENGGTTRLVGWERVLLQPGEAKSVEVSADRRLLARFDEGAHCWRIRAGSYQVSVGSDFVHRNLSTSVDLTASTLPP